MWREAVMKHCMYKLHLYKNWAHIKSLLQHIATHVKKSFRFRRVFFRLAFSLFVHLAVATPPCPPSPPPSSPSPPPSISISCPNPDSSSSNTSLCTPFSADLSRRLCHLFGRSKKRRRKTCTTIEERHEKGTSSARHSRVYVAETH